MMVYVLKNCLENKQQGKKTVGTSEGEDGSSNPIRIGKQVG